MKTMQAGVRAQAASPAGKKPWYKSLRFQILALMLESGRTLMLVGLMMKNTRSPMRVAMQ